MKVLGIGLKPHPRKKLEKGSKVKLINQHYDDTSSNPIWGGIHGNTVGIIKRVTSNGETIEVDWDTGSYNVYGKSDLELI